MTRAILAGTKEAPGSIPAAALETVLAFSMAVIAASLLETIGLRRVLKGGLIAVPGRRHVRDHRCRIPLQLADLSGRFLFSPLRGSSQRSHT